MVSAIPSFHPPSFHPRVTSSASIFPTSILRRSEELSGSPFPQWSRRLATGWVPAGYFPLPDLSRRAVTHAEQGPCCSFGTRASKVGKFRGGGRERRWQGERGRACCWGDLRRRGVVGSWTREGASWAASGGGGGCGRPQDSRSAARRAGSRCSGRRRSQRGLAEVDARRLPSASALQLGSQQWPRGCLQHGREVEASSTPCAVRRAVPGNWT